jgi:O-antigen biosynthesis protein WbqP
MKRIFDLVAAAGGLLALFWLIGLLALLVRLTSAGPGLFAQARIGRNGRVFICWKLRTMAQGTPSLATHEMPAAAVTPLGTHLRRWKLDELPQLWNVLKGEMSLVGPRPCLPTQFDVIEARRALGVLALRPGITGLAQVRGIDMADPPRLARTDADYARTRSFAGDLAILARTLTGSGRGDHVAGGPPQR